MGILLKSLILTVLFETSLGHIPMVINTWKFTTATQKAWSVLKSGTVNRKDVAIDALVAGCKVCQDEQCDFAVGYGGSPDETGETTLDAMVFDGNTMDMGGVGGIRNIKNVIGVARHVLDNTKHSLLVGSAATDFAKQLGFSQESLQTTYSKNVSLNWKKNNCQPNFWRNVTPNPKLVCGPYKPKHTTFHANNYDENVFGHDTIGMIVIASNGHIVAGTSTNGLQFKIPGRVGDSPLPGAGAYADSSVGAATCTGNGDIMMRFLPSFLAVEQMRQGTSPAKAANIAIARIAVRHPSFFGAIIVVDKKGNFGAACNGMETFPFVIANNENGAPVVKFVNCTNSPKDDLFQLGV